MAHRIVAATHSAVAHRIRGLSDRAIAWIFVAPTIFLLLAVNIFPLIWTIRLSLTDFRTNRPNNPLHFIGIENYRKILTNPDTWASRQATAQFLIWTIVLQILIGFTFAYLINKKFRGNDLWTTLIVLPMMLSPAVVGNFWTFLYQPQIGIFNDAVAFFTGIAPSSFSMIGAVPLAPWAISIADTWMWTPFVMLICLAGLRSIPPSIYEAAECDRASKWRQFWTITIPMVLPFLMLAVLFGGIENFKMFDLVVQLTGGSPGTATQLTSIDLKREAFEKWRTGYASAYAFSRFKVPLKDDLLFFILSTRMMPPSAVAIPIFLMYRELGLTDTYLGMIYLSTAVNLSVSVWLLKGFIDEIPIEYEEAALIDGYTRFQAFDKVVLPQAATGIASTAIFCLIFAWNEYAFAVLLTSGTAQTAPPFIPTIIGAGGKDWPAVAAGATILLVPIMVFTILLRKYLLRGITFGAVRK